jgi:O-antigen ligase
MITFLANFMLGLLLTGMAAFTLLPWQIPAGYNAIAVGVFTVVTQTMFALKFGNSRQARDLISIVPLVIMLLWFTLSYSQSDHTTYNLWKLQGFILFAFMPSVFVLLNYRRSLVPTKGFLLALLGFSVVSVLVIWSQARSGLGSAKWNLMQQGIDVITLGRSLGIGLIVITARVLYGGRRHYWLLLLAPLLLRYLFEANERGPVLAAIVTEVLLVFGKIRVGIKHQAARVSAYIGAAILMMGAVCLTYVYMPRLAWKNVAMDGRVQLLQDAGRTFKERPFLGVGLGAFGERMFGLSDRQYAHNILLEIVTETGLVGLATVCLFALFFFRWFCIGRRLMRGSTDPEAQFVWNGVLGVFVYFLLASQVSGDIVSNAMVWVSSTMVAATAIHLRFKAKGHRAWMGENVRHRSIERTMARRIT